MPQGAKPVPIPNPDTRLFWEGWFREDLLLQRCSGCGTYRHPPSPICQNCLSPDHKWVRANGRGKIYTFSIVRQPLRREWEPFVPYVVAVIELEEGPHILSNIVNIEAERVEIGMPVVVVFERVSDTIKLPLFRPNRNNQLD